MLIYSNSSNGLFDPFLDSNSLFLFIIIMYMRGVLVSATRIRYPSAGDPPRTLLHRPYQSIGKYSIYTSILFYMLPTRIVCFRPWILLSLLEWTYFILCLPPLQGIFTSDQIEEMVCGKPEIDVDQLESIVSYSSCSPNDAHVKFFWQTIREFSTEEKAAFLRFVWGRSRLPTNLQAVSDKFKIQSFNHRPPDDYFPVAHTCFFSIELPAYSSQEIMKERLKYAIFNCVSIDGDTYISGTNASAIHWEEN